MHYVQTRVVLLTPEARSLLGVKSCGAGDQYFVLINPHDVVDMIFEEKTLGQNGVSVDEWLEQDKGLCSENKRAIRELRLSLLISVSRWS